MTAFYLFGALLVTLVLVVVWSALREGALSDEAVEPTPERRKDAALDLLRELEFEYQTGKLPEEDYRRLRHRYALAAVQARDEVAAGESGGTRPAGRSPESAGSSIFCVACGAELAKPVRYCSQCGAMQEPSGAPRNDG